VTVEALRFQMAERLRTIAHRADRLAGTFELRPELCPTDPTSLADMQTAIDRLDRVEDIAVGRHERRTA
jgi:hypothetical protein